MEVRVNGQGGGAGSKGDKGDTGDTGPIGPTGPKGDPGDSGGGGAIFSQGLYSGLMPAIPTQANTGFTTWLNQGTATVADTATGISINSPSAGGDNIIGLLRAAPAAPYHLRFLITMSGPYASYRIVGIGWQDPVSGKILGIEIGNFGVRYMRYSGPTSSAGPISTDGNIRNPVWLHLLNDGTHYSIGLSTDGVNPYFFDNNVYSASYLGSGAAFANIIFYTNMIGGAATGTILSAPDLITSPSINVDLDDLGNVDTTGAVSGDALVFDGTNWTPGDGAPTSQYTTWSQTDISSGLSLSGGYLTVSGQSQSVASGVRCNRSVSTGKLYFEVVPNAGGTSTAIGLADASAALSDGGGTAHSTIVQITNGNIWFNNSHPHSLGAVAGKVIGVAIDATSSPIIVWFKNITDNGDWNGTSGADPATGTSGISLTGMSATVYPYAVIGASSNDNATINFGFGAFLGTVPSGFVPYGEFTNTINGGLYSDLLVTPPTQASSGFTTSLNIGGATVSDNSHGVRIVAPAGSGDNVRALIQTAPSTPYTIDFMMSLSATPQNYQGCGFGFYDGSAKIHTLQLDHDNGSRHIYVGRWTNVTTSNTPDLVLPNGFLLSSNLIGRITNDGTTLTFYIGSLGDDFVPIFSVALSSAWLGASGYQNLLFYCNRNSNNGTSAAIATLMYCDIH